MPRKPVRGKRSRPQPGQFEVVQQIGRKGCPQELPQELLQSAAEPPQLACELTAPDAYLAAWAQASSRRPDWRDDPDSEPAALRARPGVVIEIDIA